MMIAVIVLIASMAGAPHAYHAPLYLPRTSTGRIQRNPAARNDFRKVNPCPAIGNAGGACPGYVIDHVIPLKRGGYDAPWNMQWQTKDAAKIKDKTE